jgi:tetratricopeptide (TPR) repeat protein
MGIPVGFGGFKPSVELSTAVKPPIPLPGRCLLYLLDRVDVREDDPAAQELTQVRVSYVIGERRPHVSRSMRRLEARGLVRTGKVHVLGEPRRHLAYFLTEAGLREAKELRRQIEEERIAVIDLEGQETERSMYEVPRLLPRRPRLSDLLANLVDGRLDLRDYLERQARLKGGKVYDVPEATVPPHFRGRAIELDRLEAFFSDPHPRALLIVGLPGIGKTAIASRWVAGLKGTVHVLWRRLRAETTAGDLLRDIGNFLRATGHPALSEYLLRPPERGRNLPLSLLRRDLPELRAVLVFDDVHAANSEAAELLNEVLKVDAPSGSLKTVFISRERLRFLRSEDFARDRVREVELDNLTESEAVTMMEALGVPVSRRGPVFDRCGGHPLSLELAAAGRFALEGVRRTSVSWLAEEALSRIEPRHRDLLALASVVGGPVSTDSLGPEARELLRRCLIREVDGGKVDTHELVREAVLQTLDSRRLAALHVRAGRILSANSAATDGIAAIRHYLSGGAYRQAEVLAEARGEEIIDTGLSEALVSLLDQRSWSASSKPVPTRVVLLRAHALSTLGRWAEAARAYEACRRSRNRNIAAEALLGQGKAEVQRRSRLALSLLVEARDRLERLGALRQVAEAQYWIGGVHEDAGRLEEAQEAYERGRAVAFDVGDRRWEGLCTYALGRVRSAQGDFAGAVEEEREALRQLERGGHRLDIAKVCVGLGGNLLELGLFDEAETYLMRAAAEAKMTGATGILASSLYNLAHLQKETGQLDGMITSLVEALDSYDVQEQYDRAAWCAAWLAFGAWTQGRNESASEYSRRASALIRRTPEPALRAKALYLFGRACLKACRRDDARHHFEHALTEARKARLPQLEAGLANDLSALA